MQKHTQSKSACSLRTGFFVGPNGQGKTNFLEALYMLAYGKSFRSNRDEPLVRRGEKEMSLSGSFSADLESPVQDEISVKYVDRQKEIRFNGSAVKDRKQLVELLPVIIFAHDDIAFVKGSPDNQRWFFNQCLSTYRVGFIDSLRAYSKLLRNRNQIIRDGNLELLDVFNQQISLSGLEILQARKDLILEFNTLFSPLFASVSGISTPLEIEYRPSWKIEEDQGLEKVSREVISILESRLETDIQMKTTTSGPHRDRFMFRLGGRDFLQEASTGQVRLMSLLLRAAQARLFARMSGRKPILLIDDVLLELDGEKRGKFMSELPEYDQVFFTFLPDEHIEKYRRGRGIVYRVDSGEYTEITGSE
ncbi:DNA replication/repair protein RecF [Salinispira pacifica]|nr:DNA replication and repair protein RecF [Salinispira pacifica]